MTKFLCFKKCDWCSKWTLFPIGWFKDDNKDYCCEACLDHKTNVLDFNGGVKTQ